MITGYVTHEESVIEHFMKETKARLAMPEAASA